MRFQLIDAAKAEFPIQRMCDVLGVSQSGYFAWRARPACRRQREDMVLLPRPDGLRVVQRNVWQSPHDPRAS
jgi:putative transposase